MGLINTRQIITSAHHSFCQATHLILSVFSQGVFHHIHTHTHTSSVFPYTQWAHWQTCHYFSVGEASVQSAGQSVLLLELSLIFSPKEVRNLVRLERKHAVRGRKSAYFDLYFYSFTYFKILFHISVWICNPVNPHFSLSYTFAQTVGVLERNWESSFSKVKDTTGTLRIYLIRIFCRQPTSVKSGYCRPIFADLEPGLCQQLSYFIKQVDL